MNFERLWMFGTMVFLGTVVGGVGIATGGTAFGIAGPVWGSALGSVLVGIDKLMSDAIDRLNKD